MIPEIDIWRAANLMLKRYGDKALEESAARGDELWRHPKQIRSDASQTTISASRTARHKGLWAHAARPERRRAVAQGNLRRDRRQPHSAGYGLCRPLQDPPLGLCSLLLTKLKLELPAQPPQDHPRARAADLAVVPTFGGRLQRSQILRSLKVLEFGEVGLE